MLGAGQSGLWRAIKVFHICMCTGGDNRSSENGVRRGAEPVRLPLVLIRHCALTMWHALCLLT